MSITMTPTASAEVKKIMEAQREAKNLDASAFLRISILGGGCSGMQYALNFDTKFDPAVDARYDFDGVMVATEKKYDPHFDGTEIDFVDSATGRGFAIENPNFPQGAGCPGCGH